ncbi:MAG: hypothetical protein C4344_01825, partial [Acidimicrobiia bacterium]
LPTPSASPTLWSATYSGDVLVETGARGEVETTIEQLLDEALSALERAPVVPTAREALADLARDVVGRDR